MVSSSGGFGRDIEFEVCGGGRELRLNFPTNLQPGNELPRPRSTLLPFHGLINTKGFDFRGTESRAKLVGEKMDTGVPKGPWRSGRGSQANMINFQKLGEY